MVLYTARCAHISNGQLSISAAQADVFSRVERLLEPQRTYS